MTTAGLINYAFILPPDYSFQEISVNLAKSLNTVKKIQPHNGYIGWASILSANFSPWNKNQNR